MDTNQITKDLMVYLAKALKSKTAELAQDTPLVASGVMDSLDILALIQFVETQYKITLSDDDLVPVNFETPVTIVNLILRRKGNA